ncbi:cob(I)yrinic acid a,c-diamide adenosyltransferase [Anaerovorax odorimutans]|uniref:cob(I)yrinic acid a,c-diamide adenosyltransferase n=1 Tax=Anaerovorax odorimutans TaxID=109327 RepID=UPI000419AB5F|nr:cob(I)yrinic acid a,c-diamide adenosyltransferase [Anaerovorax odorimutans]
MLEKGYIQVYTGNGKGKTTASLGIALRMICAGNRVFCGQFMKGQDYSELKAEKILPNFTIEQFGSTNFINGEPCIEDIQNAKKGLLRMKEVLMSGNFDMVIFDEVNTSLYFKLFSVSEVLEVLNLKPNNVEVILTGRYAPKEIIEIADLVTEMKEIKHYYNKGIESRIGIEN